MLIFEATGMFFFFLIQFGHRSWGPQAEKYMGCLHRVASQQLEENWVGNVSGSVCDREAVVSPGALTAMRGVKYRGG